MLPVSVKGVVYDNEGRVLLCRNSREEWELPGGRMEPHESPEECVAREILEESGLRVEVGTRLGEWPFEVLPGRHVTILAYGCHALAPVVPSRSAEHHEVCFWDAGDLAALALPAVYRDAIRLFTPPGSTQTL